ncbi:MAG: type IV pilus secretin PilQ [Gammaproteobacteria bacterium]|nr:type IV pilus secretin PilQ [Gammaproteobacteria bacterium]NIR22902.1 type IV pilus secretin PilQ [Gammaproteobacteria bacterium]NIS04175.1 type IV pilus secretin PilQ [Gammaproteobacteria bacterium]NIV46359.1 type IV pilus secretin PilQ [Gammaproteobacteria bacterium]NIW01391.1 type IV pilus secretin PilQ [Gammaproteobacteria bacterium]
MRTAMGFAALAWACAAQAQSGTTLDKISFSTLPGDRVQVVLDMSGPVDEPLSFAIDEPARVALDFPGVSLNLPRKTEDIGVGMARSVTAVEAGGRSRVVLSLVKLVPYAIDVSGNQVVLTLDSSGSTTSQAVAKRAAGIKGSIKNIDFRRGEAGEGRIMVTLSDPAIVVNTFEQADDIIVEFIGVELPEGLSRRLDVIDFATPVKFVDTKQEGDNVRMVIEAGGVFDHLAYQSEDLFTLDVKELTQVEQEQAKKDKFTYTGERLSLNFQNIEVRAVLQLIADFTGLNMVASDTVSGSLTLRLKNVPWDQALDIILKTKGLAMRQTGNVILIAPTEEIAAREKLELEAQKQIEELAPLRSEFIQVNYAKASTLATLLKAEENSLMTDRGRVSVDERTNTLLVRDTAEAINSIRELVSTLDIPVRQVLIESRIVVAEDSFNRDLGVRFGVSYQWNVNDSSRTNAAVGGGLDGNSDFGGTVQPGGLGSAFSGGGADQNLLVDLPIGNPAGALKFAVVSIPDFILQLELQALQFEGRGEVISNPRVVTANQKEATIEQGTEIPFQEASSSGATSTQFKKAVLSLKVTPQITPDDRVIMDLAVNQDEVGQEFSGIPSVNTRSVTTQVLVDNGDTVVLGGIYEQIQREDTEKVPFFGDLPYLSWLFKTTSVRDDKRELIIFVTPRILKDGGTAGL